MRLNEIGTIITECWKDVPSRNLQAELDTFIVMPNHLHGILWIKDRARPTKQPLAPAGADRIPARGTAPNSLGSVIGAFKAIVTKRLSHRQDVPVTLWQRNYHEQIIRNDDALNRIREYIGLNESRWVDDPENL